MEITAKEGIAILAHNGILIDSAQAALDLAMTVLHETQVQALVLPKSCVADDFFKLSTGLAGEVLQKLTNYGIRLAIVGDCLKDASKPLRDFILESNRGKQFYFVATQEEAIRKLNG